jgi:MFS transporter, DHA1 family, multidrug resistance protein
MDNPKLVSQSEINQSHLTFRAVVIDALIKPTEIAIKDPAVAFSHIYVGTQHF